MKRALLAYYLWSIAIICCLSSVATHPCTSKLEITNKTYNSFTVRWKCETTHGTPIEGYKLLFRMNVGDPNEQVREQDVPSSFNKYTFENLECGKRYIVLMEAYGKDGNHGNASSVDITLGDQVSGHPPNDELLEIGEDSVTLKLDGWRFNCPGGIFTAIVWSETKKSYLLRAEVNMTVSKRLMITRLEPNSEYRLEAKNFEAEYKEFILFKTPCDNRTLGRDNPRKQDVIDEGSNYVTIHLNKFTCFTEFSVEYRENSETAWKLVSNDIPVDQRSLLIQNLTPGESYKLRIIGRYKYGDSVAEYSVSTTINEECGDWVQLKNRCVKIIKEAGRLVKSEAKKVCQKMQENKDTFSLLTIRSKDEIERVKDMIRQNVSYDSVWLGLQSNDGIENTWDDGTEVFFIDLNLPTYEKEPRCAKAHLNNFYSLSFTKTNCNSRNYVACEKPQPWNLAKLQKEVANLQEGQVQASEKIKKLEMQLKP